MPFTTALHNRMTIPDAAIKTLITIRQAQPELAHFIETGFTYSEVPANTCLVRAGEVPAACYFVLTGLVRAYYETPSAQVTTHFMTEGFVVTSVHACVARHAAEETIETLEDCVIAEWRPDNFFLHEPRRQFPVGVMLLVNQYFIQLEHRIRILECFGAKEKLDYFNTLYPGLLQRALADYTASYLDVPVKWLRKNMVAK